MFYFIVRVLFFSENKILSGSAVVFYVFFFLFVNNVSHMMKQLWFRVKWHLDIWKSYEDLWLLLLLFFNVCSVTHLSFYLLTVSLNLNQTLRTRQLLIDFDAGRPVLSLRAPLDLVNFQTTSRPRWPIEREVVTDTICHIGNSDPLLITYFLIFHKSSLWKIQQMYKTNHWFIPSSYCCFFF